MTHLALVALIFSISISSFAESLAYLSEGTTSVAPAIGALSEKGAEDLQRLQQIQMATEMIKKIESTSVSDENLEQILKDFDGYRFQAQMSEQEVLSKPAFEWIQNNLYSAIEKPFVGYFSLKEEGAAQGFVVIKKEAEGPSVIYILSMEGELRHLTRRL